MKKIERRKGGRGEGRKKRERGKKEKEEEGIAYFVFFSRETAMKPQGKEYQLLKIQN